MKKKTLIFIITGALFSIFGAASSAPLGIDGVLTCGPDVRKNNSESYSRNISFYKNNRLLVGRHFHGEKFKNVNWTSDLKSQEGSLLLIGRPEIGTWEIRLARVSKGIFQGGIYVNSGLQTRECNVVIKKNWIEKFEEIISVMMADIKDIKKEHVDIKNVNEELRKNQSNIATRQGVIEKSVEDSKVDIQENADNATKNSEKISTLEGRVARLENETRIKFGDLPISQQQFCKVTDDWEEKIQEAAASNNQLKIRKVMGDRDSDYRAVFRNGNFDNWIVKAAQINATENGAWLVATMPCAAILVSDICRNQDALIVEGSLPYRELEKMSVGDVVAISGSFSAPKEDWAWYPKNEFCKPVDNPYSFDIFGMEIEYLIKVSR